MRLTRILLWGVLFIETRFFGLVVGYGIKPYYSTITRPSTSHLVYGSKVSEMMVVAALVIVIDIDMVDSIAWVFVVGLIVVIHHVNLYFGAGENKKDLTSELTTPILSQSVKKGAVGCLEA